ncbi:MAG: GlsB/YeaQ/YmgE family stress response membrane protein [Corynebacteriales bacterium]|nr:GlsB/YeaQ/YmgE family stress response membrane protein [Mycobacteriales bacterium]
MIGAIIWALVTGTVLGIIGRLIVPGRQNIPWWATIGAGIVAALVGGWIADWIGVGDTDGVDWIKHGIQVLMAAVVIALVAGFMGGSRQMGRR